MIASTCVLSIINYRFNWNKRCSPSIVWSFVRFHLFFFHFHRTLSLRNRRFNTVKFYQPNNNSFSYFLNASTRDQIHRHSTSWTQRSAIPRGETKESSRTKAISFLAIVRAWNWFVILGRRQSETNSRPFAIHIEKIDREIEKERFPGILRNRPHCVKPLRSLRRE